jgi:hypothetical protein
MRSESVRAEWHIQRRCGLLKRVTRVIREIDGK